MISIRRRMSPEGSMGIADRQDDQLAESRGALSSGASRHPRVFARGQVLPLEGGKDSPLSPAGEGPRGEGSERERNGLAPFRRIDHSHGHLLTFGQMGNARGAEDRYMDEHVFAAVLAGDETKSLGVVEPFHLAGD